MVLVAGHELPADEFIAPRRSSMNPDKKKDEGIRAC
jgi:hypothetical protein